MRTTSQPSAARAETHSLQQARDLLRALASELQDLAMRVEGGISLLETRLLHDSSPDGQPSLGAPTPVIEAATFNVNWDGKTCHLGYTVPFRLMAHLVRNLGRNVPHQELLDEVWGGPRSGSAVRSAVADLRTRLIGAGMDELASAIKGHNSGHYGLLLSPTASPGISD